MLLLSDMQRQNEALDELCKTFTDKLNTINSTLKEASDKIRAQQKTPLWEKAKQLNNVELFGVVAQCKLMVKKVNELRKIKPQLVEMISNVVSDTDVASAEAKFPEVSQKILEIEKELTKLNKRYEILANDFNQKMDRLFSFRASGQGHFSGRQERAPGEKTVYNSTEDRPANRG